ncbi:hydroxyacid dehydrogenase [Deinococcus wulumuqiensis]|uniref:Hydroxyacid dehydrogenase n=1 Tax=Deinococcus wulumuqiensis TaxID=980427 RepID=A0A345IGH9_9DEIO|nr:NAD(P)-dependent oxidoreductase [Deinococcus wulumuqiensis]AXG98801.1 hydroxyacid dehydrogenase [Deinococcus wulumuqiensis]
MRVLVPDLPAFRALARPGDTSLPGADLAFYSNETGVPRGEAQGAVLWLANAATRDALLGTAGLKWVLTLTAGIDHVQGKLPPGVRLYNAHRLHDRAVAVHVVAGILAASRGLHRFRDAQRGGEWTRTSIPDSGLSTLGGKRVVIWGYGHIGKLVEELLTPFGAQVYGLTSKTEADLVDYRLAEADWVVLLLPSTDRTRGLVNAERLAALKPGVWISNQGRGDLIVTGDLLAALDTGQVGGAVLDVTDPEPLPAGHPLWERENVVITPHVASTTTDLLERGAAYARSVILDLLQGREPEGEVAPGDAY